MPHIDTPSQMPGIVGLMSFKPEWGSKLSELAQTMLRGDSELTPGERELIAARVSAGNECHFCMSSHAAAARELVEDPAVVDLVITDAPTGLTPRMDALLALADKVRIGGRGMTDVAVAEARDAGASEQDIHDTVLIAAAFCMYNRYVDGLDAVTPRDPAAYRMMGEMLATQGYVRT